MSSRGAIIFYPVVLILTVWFAWSAAAPFWGSRATMGLVRAGLGLYAVYCLYRGARCGDRDAIDTVVWLCIVTGGLAAIGGAYALFRVRESLQELDEVGLGAVLWVPLVMVIATSAIKVLLGLALWSPPVQDFLDHRAYVASDGID